MLENFRFDLGKINLSKKNACFHFPPAHDRSIHVQTKHRAHSKQIGPVICVGGESITVGVPQHFHHRFEILLTLLPNCHRADDFVPNDIVGKKIEINQS
jgi:hypothetical protein